MYPKMVKIQIIIILHMEFHKDLFLDHFYLFYMYLPKISNNFKLILFADDTNLIFYDKTILNLKDKMQIDINKLFKWLNINKLSININKTNVLLFNIRNKNINLNYILIILN